MKTSPKQTFVLVIPRFEDYSNSFYAGEVLKGAGLAASRLRADLILHIVDRESHRNWLTPDLLDHNRIDGVIFVDIDRDISVVQQAIRARMPALVLNNVIGGPINCIAIGNKQATAEAVRYLIGLGHRKIATITGDQITQAGAFRLQAFQETLEEAEIKCPKSYVVDGEFLRTPARKAAEKLLGLKNRPTAIFAASDVMALEVLALAREKNISVPKDLSVIGFDDNPMLGGATARLTTVAQPLVEMGRLGVEHMSQIARGKAKLPDKILLPAKLIKRRSARKPKD